MASTIVDARRSTFSHDEHGAGTSNVDINEDEGGYVDVLTEEECAELRSAIYDLRDYWSTNRLGYASYKIKDAKIKAVGGFLYRRNAKKFNAIFRERFGWAYDRLAVKLEEFLGAPTCYPENLALPGFHIYLKPLANMYVHYDQQHLNLKWAGLKDVNLRETLSFTLPLALPKTGAGLNLWDAYAEEMMKIPPAQKKQFLATREKTFVRYRLGRAVCHSGQRIHQMAASQNFQPGDERITLQGHGVMADGTWLLYW